MSRAYKIRVKEGITRDITASDEICSDLDILGILPANQMAELLKSQLQEKGFVEDQDGQMVRHQDSVTVTVDPKSGEVTVKSEKQETVELQGEREDWGYDDVGPSSQQIRKRLVDQVKQDLEKSVEQRKERLQSQASEKLEGVMDDLRKELSQVVNRVTAEALKQKAASLGKIKELTEDPEAGTMTIKMEV